MTPDADALPHTRRVECRMHFPSTQMSLTPSRLLLYPGYCTPHDLALVFAAAASGDGVQLVLCHDMLPSRFFSSLRNRVAPLLLARDGETIVFGTDAVATYLLGGQKAQITLTQLKHTMAAATANQPNKHARLDVRDPLQILCPIFRDATLRAFPQFTAELQAMPQIAEVATSDRDENDYQFNGAMIVFSKLKGRAGFDAKSPNDVATRIVAQLPPTSELSWLVSSIAVVKNMFFINITISPLLLNDRVNMASSINVTGGEHIPAPLVKRERVLIDFSSPNIAKEMHVGHLRSTIIGDCIARVLEYVGHDVLRVNHVGDWGTQFGMLLQYLAEDKQHPDTLAYLSTLSLSDLTKLYRAAKILDDADGTPEKPGDPQFKIRARAMVVKLQSGSDPFARQVWQKLVELSQRGFNDVYQRLNVVFPDQRVPGTGYCGESFYQPLIPAVIKELYDDKHLARIDSNALVLFTGAPSAKTVSKENVVGEVPLILRKSDGGFGYDSTDVAAVRYRLKTLNCDRILYVTDAGQEMHFDMVFACARVAGWVDAGKRLEHVKFGVVTQKGGGKLKTRSGETVTLVSLLDEACTVMRATLESRLNVETSTTAKVAAATSTTGMDQNTHLDRLAATIGYAACKYADLRNSREKDYEFDMDRMLSPDGDTAVYLLYAYARVSSVVEKATLAQAVSTTTMYDSVGASFKERRLALRVTRFGETVRQVEHTLCPHVLCGFLYHLSYETASFLTDDNERVINVGGKGLEEKRGTHRLVLVKAVRAVLYEGLGLMGIVPFERM